MTPLPIRRFMWIAGLALAALSGCKQPCHHAEQCDIRAPHCQKQIMSAVQCLRGGSTKLPPVHLMSEQALAERLTKEQSTSPAAELSFERTSRGLALFELAPSHYDIADSEQDSASDIAAVYFEETREIVVVDRGQALDTVHAVQVFAHELTHALQDQDYNLAKYRSRWVTTFDSSLAIKAIIEGEAVLYEQLINLQLRGLDPKQVDWEGFFLQWRGDELDNAEQDLAPVTMAHLRFPYAFGGGLVAQYWLAGGRRALDTLVAHPPLSTREVLFGPPPLAARTSFEKVSADAQPELGSAYQLVSADSLGAWVGRIFAQRMGLATYERWDPVQTELADVFVVQADAKHDHVVASWRILVDDGASPSEWPGASMPPLEGWSDNRRREAVLFASETELGDPRKLAWTGLHEATSKDDGIASALATGLNTLPPSGCLQQRAHELQPRLADEEVADETN